MPRGEAVEVGTETVNANGYTMVKTEEGWRFKHHVVWEKATSKFLQPGQRVIFKDKNRTNFSPDNLEMVEKKRGKPLGASARERVLALERKLREFNDEMANEISSLWESLNEEPFD